VFPTNPSAGDTFNFELPYPDPYSADPSTPATIEYQYNGICWAPQNAGAGNSFNLRSRKVKAGEQNPTRPTDEQLRAPVTIAASTIAAKCLAGLELTASGLGLLANHYPEDQAEITDSYTTVLDTLLGDEGLVGFLNANEVLVILRIDQTALPAGAYVTEQEIVDIAPIGEGTLPADVYELNVDSAALIEPSRNPDPIPPVTRDFTLPQQEKNAEFSLSFEQFLQNSTFDYYRYLYNQVKVTVTSPSNCTIQTGTAGVTITPTTDFVGIATLQYSITDGATTSNISTVRFEVVVGADGTTGASFIDQSGLEVSYVTSDQKTIFINYDNGGSRATAEYPSYPATYTRDFYGVYGELLRRVEVQEDTSASAAANIFQLWLTAGLTPPNYNVNVRTETLNTYSYVRKNKANQGQTCGIGGLCQANATLPSNPTAGDAIQYGECSYTFNGLSWEPTPPDGSETVLSVGTPPLSETSQEDIEPKLLRSVVTTTEAGAYICGGINWPQADDRVPPLSRGDAVTEYTTTDYSDYTNAKGVKVQKVVTRTFRARYKTAEGQQFLAAQAQLAGDLGVSLPYSDIYGYALALVLDDETVTTQVERVNDAGVSLSQRERTPVMPRTWDEANGYQEGQDYWREQNRMTAEMARGKLNRFVRWGTRYGVSLQVVPWVLPMYPLSPLYLDMRSVVGAYVTNGISIVFNSDGILANVDALLVGGVGGTGTPWFPLPSGVSLMEAPAPSLDPGAIYANSIPTPVGFDPNNPALIWSALPTTESDSLPATLTPAGVVLSDPPQYRITLGVHTRVECQRLGWSLTPVITDQALGVKTGIAAVRTSATRVPAAGVSLAGLAPSVSTGASAAAPAASVGVSATAPRIALSATIKAPVANVGLSSVAPAIRIGAAVKAPLATVTVGATAPINVGPPGPTLTPATAVVAVAGTAPAVSAGKALAVPTADVQVSGSSPQIGLQGDYFAAFSSQVYGWDRDFQPDWWAD
jgi:hypothetical protein